MRNILITGVGGDVACSIIRCLLSCNSEDKIYGIDIKDVTPYMDQMEETFVAPRYTNEGYMPFVKGLIEKYHITHFLPTTEPEIILADKERAYFGNTGVKLVINNEQVINICTSKYKTAKFLSTHGINAPETYLAVTYAGELQYPFIMKADSGCGSKQLKIIHNEEEWNSAEKEGAVCQQMVGDAEHEYTIGVFSDGEIVRSITLRRKLGFGGLSALVECVDIPEISRLAYETAKAFGLRGSINIQLRKEENSFFVFEINPRLSSTTGFRHRFGFTDVVWWLDMLDNITIPQFENKAVGKMGIKILDDVVLKNRRGGGYWPSRISRYSDACHRVMAA